MQVTVEGVVHRSYPGRVIEYAGTPGNPNAVNTAGAAEVGGAVVQARSLERDAGYPIITLTTNEDGYLPGHLLPDVTGTDVQCVYKFGSFDFPGWSDDVPTLAADAAAAKAAAEAALGQVQSLLGTPPLTERVQALEDAGPYLRAVPGYEPGRQGAVPVGTAADTNLLVTGDVLDVVD